MALLLLPLSAMDEAQLSRLIQAQTAEARDIEYKRETYGGTDADHAECLADISNMPCPETCSRGPYSCPVSETRPRWSGPKPLHRDRLHH